MAKSRDLEVTGFHLEAVEAGRVAAAWRTTVPAHCRFQLSKSPSLTRTYVIEGDAATEFRFDSMERFGESLPAASRWYLRVLAEDASGARASSDTLLVILPPDGAFANLRAVPLSESEALFLWETAEPCAGQVVFTDGGVRQHFTPMDAMLRREHYAWTDGLQPGREAAWRVRGAVERRRYEDEFLRMEPIHFQMPQAGAGPFVRSGEASGALSHGGLRLLVDAATGVRPLRVAGGGMATLAAARSQGVGGAFRLVLADGTVVDEFAGDATASIAASVRTEFGEGTAVRLSGTATLAGGAHVTRTVEVEVYDAIADACVLRCRYETDAADALSIAATESAAFTLDRRLAARNEAAFHVQPYDLAAYVPVANDETRSETYTTVRLAPGYDRANQLAGRTRIAHDTAAVPCFDFWGPETGLALGHLSPYQIRVSAPIRVREDGRVDFSIRDEHAKSLSAASPIDCPVTFLAVHGGDFFDGVTRFRELMAAQGLAAPPSPPAAYEPIWSTWGYSCPFNAGDIFEAIPILRRLGVSWIQFDDPWFSDLCNFVANPEIFPRGEADLADLIARIRAEGFHVRLWTTVGHATPNAPHLCDHPDCLVKTPTPGELEHDRKLDLCPSLPENVELGRSLVERFWRLGAESVYEDMDYSCPECLDESHPHGKDADAVWRDYPMLYQAIYERAMELSGGEAMVMLCPCGAVPNWYVFPFVNMAATADPMQFHARKRVKSLKALMGPRAAISFDYVELCQNDFASSLGSGSGVLHQVHDAARQDPRARV